MCLGFPMQVVEMGEGHALCEADGQMRRIDMMLVGEQPVGTWLLTFLDTAREVMTPDQACQVREALRAVEMAMRGDAGVDDLFADLVEREPQLPDFLRSPAKDLPIGD